MLSKQRCTWLLLGLALGLISNAGCGGSGTSGGSPTPPPPPITPTAPPTQPVDKTPINGEVYYVINQLSGLQADLTNDSTAIGDHVIQQQRSFTDLGQRWAFTKLSAGGWQINNMSSTYCFDTAIISSVTYVVQNPCTGSATEQWTLTPSTNGYYTIANTSTGFVMDVFQASASGGAWLDLSALSGSPTQAQQWLLRPAFFRGVDNALLEKQEAARSAAGLSWWKDAGTQQDVLGILKNHGVNMVRLRPSSAPPYSNPSQAGCSGNLCYGETEAQDLDLAKRARNLGMSIELTLLFDGSSSSSIPSSWTSDSFAQLQTDIYNYTKQEIEKYRQAGVMPDLVSIGNEVDTGFLGSNSPTGANFGDFAIIQKQAIQAAQDAAADTSSGPALPAPLTCIHITPAWDLTDFFTLANQNGIQYDAICQSYYPIFHGPLTPAQAAASNPNNQPIEQSVLVAAANNIAKPIFIIEAGEHYENGFQSNDPWYAPPSEASQRQFLIDLQNVENALPNNLGMGLEYWDATGVNVPNPNMGLINGDNGPDAIYVWNGLTLFDNADSSGTTNPSAANYSAVLPGIDALGGKFDSVLNYKLVNRANGQVLSVNQSSNQPVAMLNTAVDTGNRSLAQQWKISSNNDGYFQIASAQPGPGNTTNALDDSAGSTSSGGVIVQSLADGSAEQEWDVVSAGGGYFNVVNHLSGHVLDANGGTGPQAGFVVQEVPSAVQTQQWEIVPVH
ncbi:MAG TPA: glycosyl hydrolase 53 family protein [Terriglobales bacterium]|nr:glycosyl hydrolase 53 family protein [Terriglobales bacterium]